jgi:MFS transporter, SP family, general alpha glucoside:H+ symporter
MSEPVESKSEGGAPEVKAGEATPHVEHYHNLDLDENAKAADFKADAVEAENAEHNMTVLEAVRAYPMATFWAFVMSFTIVSRRRPLPPTPPGSTPHFRSTRDTANPS